VGRRLIFNTDDRPARAESGARGVLCGEHQADRQAGDGQAAAVFGCADRATIRQVGFACTTRLRISFHGTQSTSSGPEIPQTPLRHS